MVFLSSYKNTPGAQVAPGHKDHMIRRGTCLSEDPVLFQHAFELFEIHIPLYPFQDLPASVEEKHGGHNPNLVFPGLLHILIDVYNHYIDPFTVFFLKV